MDLLAKGMVEVLSKKVSSNVKELLDCEPIATALDCVGAGPVSAYVEYELVNLVMNINIDSRLTLQDHQIPIIAKELIETYKWESLEDFTLCFRRGMMGRYGDIFRLDGAIISGWFSQYLDEKYQALEERLKNEKKKEDPKEPVVDGGKYIQEMLDNLGKPEKDDNSKANEYQRAKLAYKPLSKEEIQARDEALRQCRIKTIKEKNPTWTESQIQEKLKELE